MKHSCTSISRPWRVNSLAVRLRRHVAGVLGLLLGAAPAAWATLPAVAGPEALVAHAPRHLAAAISSTAAGGNWSAPATWVGGVVPTATDDVTIVGGAVVTLNVAAQAASLTVNAGGTLGTSATTSYSLQVGGSVTNNGTLALSASSTVGSDLRFVGAGSVTFGGTGTTDLFTMSLAKSVRADVVDMDLPTLTVKGGAGSAVGFLFTRTTGTTPVDDMTGTLKISGTATLTSRVFGNAASYIIPASGAFWLSNANYMVVAQTGSPTVNGQLRLTAGTFNVGTSSGNSIQFISGSTYTQEGGTLNTAGRFGSFTSATAAAAMTFNLNGGTLNVCTVGNASGTPSFGVNGTTTISGGTINLVQRSTATTPLDYYVAGTYTFTGGTVNVGTAATATNFDFRIRGSFPNLTLDNLTNPKSALLQGQTNVFGTTLIQPTTNLNLNGTLLLQIGATITNNGTLTGSTASSTLYFQGSVAQTLGGTGTFTILRTLSLDNSGGGVTLTVPLTVYRVNMFTGNLNGTSNLTIGDGTLVIFVVQIGVTSNTNTSGSFTSAPTFNIGTGAYSLVYAQETTNRTTGFEVPPTRVVDAVSISNTNGVTLAGGNLTINTSAVTTGTLTLTSGILTTSAANTVIIGTGATTFPTGSATSYVRGPEGITVNSATAVSRTFAVGDAAGWRPVVVGGITTSSAQTFTATVVNGATGGSVSGNLSSLNPTRYVRLQNSAALPASATVQLSYGADDVAGAPATTMVAQAATATGAYAPIGGAAATTPTTGIVSTQPITPGNDFFVLANTEGGTLATSTTTGCAGSTSGTLTLSGNAAGSSVTNYQADTGSGFANVAGTNTGLTYAFSNLTTTTTFRAVLTTSDGRTVTSAPVTVTVTPVASSAFTYPAGPYCTSGTTNPTPTSTGAAGGTYTATPAGLTLDAGTGVVTLGSSAPGTYTVTYTVGGTCGSSTPQSLTINAAPTANFTYPTATTCTGTATTLAATLTGSTTAGTFSLPAATGLSINATTGAVTVGTTAAAGTYVATNTVAAANGCAAVSSTASFTLTTCTAPDLTISTGTPAAPTTIPAGTYNNITITGTGNPASSGNAILGGAVQVGGAFVVQNGGSLNTTCQALTGAGSFTLAAGGTLYVCDAAGLTATGSTGAVQVTGTRSFSTDASYVYNGTAAQSTGSGLPIQVRNLTTTNNSTVTLTNAAVVAQVVTVGGSGNLALNGNVLTLPSSASGTALVVNSGTGMVSGATGTMQRYLDASGNTGPSGYRHYSAPVSGATVSSLSTSAYGGSFTAQTNTAYNTANPNLLTLATYPNVFSYDESKIAGSPAVTFSDFDKGYQSPASPSTALTVGRGYAVQIGNGEKVQFTGTFNTGSQSITGLTYAAAGTPGAGSAGWALVGNPYPAPLAWGTVAGSQLTGVDAAAYVFQSTSAYAGRYTSFTNGVGAGSGLLSAGQAFFVHTSTPGTSGSIALTNANRLTTYGSQPNFQRQGETRPLVRLSLALGSQPATVATAQDETFVYFETGASDGFDGKFDAYKLANPSGYYLGSVTPGASPVGLSIDARSPLAVGTLTEIPLWVSLPAGSYSLTATELRNFATLAGGTTVYLRDALLGTLTDLATVPSHAFSVAAGASYAGRFALVFRTSSALATTPAAGATLVSLYPNPVGHAQGAVTLAVTGLPAGAATLEATVFNALGQVVGRTSLPTPAGAATRVSLPTTSLATGIYQVRLTGAGLPGGLTCRLTVD